MRTKNPGVPGFFAWQRYYAPGAQLILIQWVMDAASTELGHSEQLGSIAYHSLAQLSAGTAAMSVFPVIIRNFSA